MTCPASQVTSSAWYTGNTNYTLLKIRKVFKENKNTIISYQRRNVLQKLFLSQGYFSWSFQDYVIFYYRVLYFRGYRIFLSMFFSLLYVAVDIKIRSKICHDSWCALEMTCHLHKQAQSLQPFLNSFRWDTMYINGMQHNLKIFKAETSSLYLIKFSMNKIPSL